jgi:geranylgeranyl diphosphate synthase type I
MLGEAPIRGSRPPRWLDGPDEARPTMPEAMPSEDPFESFVARVRAQVDAWLSPWLDARVAEARARGAEVGDVAEAVAGLVLRGGKRVRAVLLAATYEGLGGEGGAAAVTAAGAALELLQAYLLVHDDWMDGDEVRRGGPSVPALMRARFGSEDGAGRHVSPRAPSSRRGLADAASILAGDLACAWAQASLLETPLPPVAVLAAARELARMHEDVVHGQMLDVRGRAADARGVEALHALKTASYTVRGPVVMGARLAGAGQAAIAALEAFAVPLGVAFQLRDDLMGVFGDTRAMGKPSGGDLREGKRSAPIVEAMRDERARARLERVLGRAGAAERDVVAAVAAIEACGARRRVEERIAALVRESRAALERAPLDAAGRERLASAIVALTQREA